jgi:DNA polymerase/3'-5' exonuclease PolX
MAHAVTHGMDRNAAIAEKLREVADLLALQQANPYRVAAYRRAADTLLTLDEDVADRLDRQGMEGLTALPGIDRAIGSAVQELVRTRRLSLLDRLRGTLDPELLFAGLPGVGAKTARLLHDTLSVDTLEALEAAAHDGRLAQVPGMGPRTCAAAFRSSRIVWSRSRPSTSSSTWTANIASAPRAVTCDGLRHADSIRRTRAGCRSCTRSAGHGTSPRSSPIPRAPTSSAVHKTG